MTNLNTKKKKKMAIFLHPKHLHPKNLLSNLDLSFIHQHLLTTYFIGETIREKLRLEIQSLLSRSLQSGRGER